MLEFCGGVEIAIGIGVSGHGRLLYQVDSSCVGEDWRDLYIVSADNTDDPSRRGSVFRTSIDVPGVPVPPALV